MIFKVNNHILNKIDSQVESEYSTNAALIPFINNLKPTLLLVDEKNMIRMASQLTQIYYCTEKDILIIYTTLLSIGSSLIRIDSPEFFCE